MLYIKSSELNKMLLILLIKNGSKNSGIKMEQNGLNKVTLELKIHLIHGEVSGAIILLVILLQVMEVVVVEMEAQVLVRVRVPYS